MRREKERGSSNEALREETLGGVDDPETRVREKEADGRARTTMGAVCLLSAQKYR